MAAAGEGRPDAKLGGARVPRRHRWQGERSPRHLLPGAAGTGGFFPRPRLSDASPRPGQGRGERRWGCHASWAQPPGGATRVSRRRRAPKFHPVPQRGQAPGHGPETDVRAGWALVCTNVLGASQLHTDRRMNLSHVPREAVSLSLASQDSRVLYRTSDVRTEGRGPTGLEGAGARGTQGLCGCAPSTQGHTTCHTAQGTLISKHALCTGPALSCVKIVCTQHGQARGMRPTGLSLTQASVTSSEPSASSS